MTKKEIITLANALGFEVDLDRFNQSPKFIRFKLIGRACSFLEYNFDIKELMFIWYKDYSLKQNLFEASNILFKAGQYIYKLKLEEAQNTLHGL